MTVNAKCTPFGLETAVRTAHAHRSSGIYGQHMTT